MNEQILAKTESVCPLCLRTVVAARVAKDDNVYLVKRCPEHGEFSTVVWRGLETYRRWSERGSRAATPPVTETEVERGCPHDCGICPDHRQHSCCVLLEVTQRCNLRCPVCFAGAGADTSDPSIAEIETWLDRLRQHGSQVNIQLSGGEPTVRDDLPEIIRRIRGRGFDFVQLNTNGVRLAKEADYTQRLADAGLDCAFLQFDGVSDDTYRRIRGARLLEIKQQAILRCAEAGLAVVLVPTLVPGVNVGEIGAIVDFALARVPAVRAVHFQPISYFGRYPAPPADRDRITLPEVMHELESQSDGMIRVGDFGPGASENVFCSFVGKFELADDGRLRSTRQKATSCCSTGNSGCGCGTPVADEDGPRSRRIVARQWAARARQQPAADTPTGVDISSFDAFLAARGQILSISGMAFQDAWNLDLERLRECFIHIVAPDRRIIPFCAYNLTSASGEPLYRMVERESAHA
jgi:tetraether lipid synthase